MVSPREYRLVLRSDLICNLYDMLTEWSSTYSRFTAIQFIQVLTILPRFSALCSLSRWVCELIDAENVAPMAARNAMIINMQHKPTAYGPFTRQRFAHGCLADRAQPAPRCRRIAGNTARCDIFGLITIRPQKLRMGILVLLLRPPYVMQRLARNSICANV